MDVTTRLTQSTPIPHTMPQHITNTSKLLKILTIPYSSCNITCAYIYLSTYIVLAANRKRPSTDDDKVATQEAAAAIVGGGSSLVVTSTTEFCRSLPTQSPFAHHLAKKAHKKKGGTQSTYSVTSATSTSETHAGEEEFVQKQQRLKHEPKKEEQGEEEDEHEGHEQRDAMDVDNNRTSSGFVEVKPEPEQRILDKMERDKKKKHEAAAAAAASGGGAEDLQPIMEEEPLVSGGLAATLKLLSQKGGQSLQTELESVSGRARDKVPYPLL